MKRRVLIVEDNEAVGTMLKRVLETNGFEARWVSTGADALAAASKRPPDVVLLDMELPDLHGTRVARRLRRSLSDVRLIGLSGEDVTADDRRVLDDFLLKPAAFPDILRAVGP